MAGVIAKLVQRTRNARPRKPTPEQEAHQLSVALANAGPGDCKKCGGPMLLLGNKFSLESPRQCVRCGDKIEGDNADEKKLI